MQETVTSRVSEGRGRVSDNGSFEKQMREDTF
jgi:hypothetical protein